MNFITYDENKSGEWASFGMTGDCAALKLGMPMSIHSQILDTTIGGNGNLAGKATTTFIARRDGTRVVPFQLFPSLRVHSVTAEGQPLSFIQEDKNEDAQFAVILPKALAAGESYTITTTYEGKEAVTNEGSGNYYPVAREDWFPNNPLAMFGRIRNV